MLYQHRFTGKKIFHPTNTCNYYFYARHKIKIFLYGLVLSSSGSHVLNILLTSLSCPVSLTWYVWCLPGASTRGKTSEEWPTDLCAQRRFRSACAFAQSDQNFHWAHFDNQWYEVSSRGQWRVRSDCADAQSDLNLCWALMSQGTFSQVAAHIFLLMTTLYTNEYCNQKSYVCSCVTDLEVLVCVKELGQAWILRHSLWMISHLSKNEWRWFHPYIKWLPMLFGLSYALWPFICPLAFHMPFGLSYALWLFILRKKYEPF